MNAKPADDKRPFRDGRVRMTLRLTPEVNDRLLSLAQRRGLSVGELVTRWALGDSPAGRSTGEVGLLARNLRDHGLELRQIAEALNAAGYRTARGKRWNGQAAWRLLRRSRSSIRRPSARRV